MATCNRYARGTMCLVVGVASDRCRLAPDIDVEDTVRMRTRTRDFGEQIKSDCHRPDGWMPSQGAVRGRGLTRGDNGGVLGTLLPGRVGAPLLPKKGIS